MHKLLYILIINIYYNYIMLILLVAWVFQPSVFH
jgi:hypothetical protein